MGNVKKEENKKSKKKLLYIIFGLGVAGIATGAGLFFGLQKNDKSHYSNTQVKVLHKIIKGNSNMAAAFRAVMTEVTIVKAENFMKPPTKPTTKPPIKPPIIGNKTIKTTTNIINKKKLTTKYVATFKKELSNWIKKNQATLKLKGITSKESTIMSWFDFNNAKMTEDTRDPMIWNYNENGKKLSVLPYRKYDIKIPLIAEVASEDWTFKVLSYLDPKGKKLVKGLKAEVGKLSLPGNINTNQSASAVQIKSFNDVHDAAVAYKNNPNLENGIIFNNKVDKLAIDLAEYYLTKEIAKLKVMGKMRLVYNKTNVITDLQKLNIFLKKYNNDLQTNEQGDVVIDPNTKLGTLNNPKDSTMVKVIANTFKHQGPKFFASFDAVSANENKGGYANINGQSAFKIDIAAYLKAQPNKEVALSSYQYVVNQEKGDEYKMSWKSTDKIEFYIARSFNSSKKDVIKAILDTKIQKDLITQSSDSKVNLIASLKRIKDLLSARDVKNKLNSNEVLEFELLDPLKLLKDKRIISNETNINELANTILSLEDPSSIFSMNHTTGVLGDLSSQINGHYVLTERLKNNLINRDQKIQVGGTTLAPSDNIIFKVDTRIQTLISAMAIITNTITEPISKADMNGSNIEMWEEILKERMIKAYKAWREKNPVLVGLLDSTIPKELDKNSFCFINIRPFNVDEIIFDIYYKGSGILLPILKDQISSLT